MEIRQDPISSSALELLQIRAIAFHDTAKKLAGTFETDASGKFTPEDNFTSQSPQESVTALLDEMADIERLHATGRVPEWFGPAERLSLQVASSGELLLEYADQLLSHIESHDKDAHAYGCRCYEFQDLLVARIQPALAEWKDLQKAIEQLRKRTGAKSGTSSAANVSLMQRRRTRG